MLSPGVHGDVCSCNRAIGGFVVLTSAHRVLATLGGWLAALGGAWFVVGVPLSATWDSPSVGLPTGGTTRQVLEYLGFFGGLGVVIVFLAAFALGRFAVVGVREVERAAQAVTPEEHVTNAPPAAPERAGETAGRHRFRWRRSKHASAQ